LEGEVIDASQEVVVGFGKSFLSSLLLTQLQLQFLVVLLPLLQFPPFSLQCCYLFAVELVLILQLVYPYLQRIDLVGLGLQVIVESLDLYVHV
jgi:hypothetical protein